MEEAWKIIATTSLGALFSMSLMLIRSDWIGRKAAEEVRRDLTQQIARNALEIQESERRMNERVEKVEIAIGQDIADIKTDLREIRAMLTKSKGSA